MINIKHKMINSILKIKNILSSKYHSPLIVYGNSKIKCKHIINILNNIYNIPNNTKIDYSLELYKTNNYIIVNCSLLDIDIINNLIHNLEKNLFINKKPTIIFNKFNMTKLKQRSYINLLNKSISIIIITDNYNNIINNIKSYCIISSINDNNKSCEIYNNVISYIINIYKLYEINESIFHKLKEISKFIVIISLEFKILLQLLIDHIFNDNHIIYKRKLKLLNFISDIEHKYLRSYNKYVYIEFTLFQIYNICYL